MDARGARFAEASKRIQDQALQDAAWGWDNSPITTARMSAEIWNQIKNEDWSLASEVVFQSFWPTRLWNFTKHYQFIGGHGAYGVGYNAPAAVGAALANRKYGRLTVNIQSDGDLNYAPGVLWTAAHHKIPLLNIMHNNRSYHQERMYVADMAARAQRDVSRVGIGNDINDLNVDYAAMAKAYGMYGIGPIENPADLGPALKRAIEVVKKGEPVLADFPYRGRGRAKRACRQHRQGKATVHQTELLLLPWHGRPGRPGRSAARCHGTDRRRPHPIRPQTCRRHAGLYREAHLRSGTARHPRVPEGAACCKGTQRYTAAGAIAGQVKPQYSPPGHTMKIRH